MKSPDTWMAFYPGAYLANTLHLTRAQHGSYLMLILAAFKNGGWLPNSEPYLIATARCSAKEWAAERETFAAFFEVSEDRWTHDRVVRELAKAERNTEQRRIAGLASATARQRPLNGRSNSVVNPVVTEGQQTGRPSPSPSQSTSHGENLNDAERAGDPDGPRARLATLPDSAKWAERLAKYEPWLSKNEWKAHYGPRPDASGTPNQSIPAEQLRAWKARYQAGMSASREAAE